MLFSIHTELIDLLFLNKYTEYWIKLSYITLDVTSQTSPLCVNGNSRSSVCAFDIGVVVRVVVQLEKDKKKEEEMYSHDFPLHDELVQS